MQALCCLQLLENWRKGLPLSEQGSGMRIQTSPPPHTHTSNIYSKSTSKGFLKQKEWTRRSRSPEATNTGLCQYLR